LQEERPNPVNRGLMRTDKFDGNNTICQTIREAYLICKQSRIKYQLRIIMAMAKSMDDKLQEYKKIFVEQDGIRGSDQ